MEEENADEPIQYESQILVAIRTFFRRLLAVLFTPVALLIFGLVIIAAISIGIANMLRDIAKELLSLRKDPTYYFHPAIGWYVALWRGEQFSLDAWKKRGSPVSEEIKKQKNGNQAM